jgi:dihydrolipoamide dehydrogenase
MSYMDYCIGVLRTVKEAAKDGIDTGEVKVNYATLIGEKEKVVKGVVTGMEARLQAIGVEVVIGSAKLVSPREVVISFGNGNKETVQAGKIIIATGSKARRYHVPGAYDAGVLTTRELLALPELPESLAIIGRSVTALELATVWANLGSKVTLLARKPRLLPNEDEELAAYIQHTLEENGVKMYSGVDIERIDDTEQGKLITIINDGTEQKIAAQFAVFALGQSPHTDGLGLENAGIDIVDGGIKTNEKMESSVAGIYAAGDVTGEMMLASIAMSQGGVAADNAMGADSRIDYRVVPRSIRTVPPIASVGITEGEARNQGLDIKIGKFPFAQNPRASMAREPEGFVKIIADSASGEILGAHIIGPQAPELIHEVVVVMKMKGTVRDIAAAIHGHPSLHETVQRTAQGLC